MKYVKTLLFVAIVSLGFLFVHTNVWAVPNLGVATGEFYIVGEGDVFEDYQDFFTDGSFVSGGEDNEGFAFFSSGSTLSVWSNKPDEEVWLMAENAFAVNNLSFGGNPINTDMDPIFGPFQIDGYTSRPYWGLSLGTVGTNGWSQLSDPNDPNNPFNANGPFWVFEAELTFDGTLPSGSYLFAASDWRNTLGVIEGGEFSPKTASGIARVPEPSTMLLLGIGLAGLCSYGRRKIKKK
jgi:hypothetical protein